MTIPSKLPDAPWDLQFDREGTEDVGIICDANGDDLVRSRHFWLPEGDQPVPPTLVALRLMTAAPKLLAMLQRLLGDRDIASERRSHIEAVIAEATGGTTRVTKIRNRERARLALKSLEVFTDGRYTGDHPDRMRPDELERAVGVLICNLLHYSLQEGFNPQAVMETGHACFKTNLLLDS